MFARIIRDPASLTAGVYIYIFYESLQIAFPNTVLVNQFRAAEVYSLLVTPRKRGAGSAELISI